MSEATHPTPPPEPASRPVQPPALPGGTPPPPDSSLPAGATQQPEGCCVQSPPPPEANSANTAAPVQPRPSRSFLAGAALYVLGRGSAWFGLIWITLLVIGALFAPLLANSHPLLMKMDGHWSSPMLRHLTPSDVILLALPISLLIAWLLKRLLRRTGRFLIALWLPVILAVSAAAIYFIQPPLTVVYEQYRQAAAEGRLEHALYAPLPFSPADRLRDQPELRLTNPTLTHPLGTTPNGADLLSNMIHACRIALSIGFISTGIAIVIGILIGGLMGYFSGIVDLLGMRLVEIFSAIPTLLLLLCFVAFFEVNLYVMMAIIGLTGWVGYALFIRAEFLRLRHMDFVQAAVALGLPLRSILWRHMLPNGVTPVLVNASFSVAGAILAESTLSFLGIGLVEEASWGKLLNQALGVGGTFYWWVALYPGLAIFLTVFAYNLVGEAMRDAIDPHTRRLDASRKP
ncbi:MAG: ABC transporter permease subunit [Phycisphaeraceae bacterium]|nr:ABC transporter permease subunit [Phycisphaeraceae bacterium]